MHDDRKRESKGTALVTGASEGIGREIAILLAAEGFDLALVARNERRLRETADAAKAAAKARIIRTDIIPMDLSTPGAAAALLQTLDEGGIRIDALVNNAGFNVPGPFSATDAEAELAMVRTLAITPLTLMKPILRDMLARGRGRVLNVASMGGFMAVPYDASYGASKAFLLSLSEAIAEECKGSGVTVTTLCPGATASEFAARASMMDRGIFKGNVMKASDVARIGVRAMLKGKRLAIPGLANRLQAFAIRLSPRSFISKVVAALMRGPEKA